MYEISLVPDVKAELLRKQRLRNLFVLICVGVAIACGAVVMILLSVMGGQTVSMNNQKKEIGCRYDMKMNGKTLKSSDCKSNMGTPVMYFNNRQTLLTIQDQLKSLDTLNNSMIKFSRIFGLLDVLLLDEEKGSKIEVSELAVDFSSMTLSFDAVGYDKSSANIGYKPLEAFKKNAERMRYDYGEYMRRGDDENDEVIPYFCISEETINGLVYGVYSKGAPGCEAPMVEPTEEDKDAGDDEESDEKSNEEASTEPVENEIEKIYIRRTYKDRDDYESVREGKDKYWDESVMGKNNYKGYYFESSCISWSEDGKMDEAATLETCPFLSDEIAVTNSSYGLDTNEQLVLTFQSSVPISTEIFLSGNHNMQILSPTRQNVTDSYVQVRDMFVAGDSIKEAN